MLAWVFSVTGCYDVEAMGDEAGGGGCASLSTLPVDVSTEVRVNEVVLDHAGPNRLHQGW